MAGNVDARPVREHNDGVGQKVTCEEQQDDAAATRATMAQSRHTKCEGDGEAHISHKVGGQTLQVTRHTSHVANAGEHAAQAVTADLPQDHGSWMPQARIGKQNEATHNL